MMVQVTGTFRLADGTADRGTVRFRPSLMAVDATPDPHVVTTATVSATLDTAGAFTVDVVASDDAGWQTVASVPYVVTWELAADRGGQVVAIPGPGPWDLADLLTFDGDGPLPAGHTHDEYLTEAEHAALDHSAIPGAGGGEGGVTVHAQLGGLDADDHPQYHTDARGDARYDARYDPLGASATAITDHEAAPDPHPQYLTQTEGDAAYAPLSHEHPSLERGVWVYDTATTPSQPGTGRVRIDAAAFVDTTEVYLSETTANGMDVSPLLELVQAGDLLAFQQESDASNWGRARITGPAVDNGDWRTIPVEYVDSGGGGVNKNQNVIIQVTLGTGGGGGGGGGGSTYFGPSTDMPDPANYGFWVVTP